jgi:hypothetical protein
MSNYNGVPITANVLQHIFSMLTASLRGLSGALHIRAQYPSDPANYYIIRSPVNDNVTIRYKTSPAGTCSTAWYAEATCWLRQFSTMNPEAHTADLQYQHVLLVHKNKSVARDSAHDNLVERRSC